MRRTLLLLIVASMFTFNIALADIFGTGANQFEIEFVAISGDAGDLGNWVAGMGHMFSGVNHDDYRMGMYEITNDQWTKFTNDLGVSVTGSPSIAYDTNPYWKGENIPMNAVSWYEAAQFINWLNTSTGHQAAYKFTGTQGTSDYTMEVWQPGDTGYDVSNPYRNNNAYYFLPTEDEWIKAAYWNGTSLQTWATVGDINPTQNGWNFYDDKYATDPYGPWDVGSGSEELNGTYDMMGNLEEWTESPYLGHYIPGSGCITRGGSYYYSFLDDNGLKSFERFFSSPDNDMSYARGFRVASVPEPATLSLLAFGGLLLRKRK